jgi:hypothetical protein
VEIVPLFEGNVFSEFGIGEPLVLEPADQFDEAVGNRETVEYGRIYILRGDDGINSTADIPA